MKYLLIILLFFIVSCSSTTKTPQIVQTYDDNFSFKDDINESIIDGFYNGDTTGISKTIYLLK